jgi:Flp pilus assembly pilin Flp
MMRLSSGATGHGKRRGQMIIEYAVMFTVIVAVVIYAAINVVRPSVNRFFNATGRVLENATNEIESRF